MASEELNAQIETAARRLGVKVQRDVRGRDTGTDGMAGVLASVDCAATSVGALMCLDALPVGHAVCRSGVYFREGCVHEHAPPCMIHTVVSYRVV